MNFNRKENFSKVKYTLLGLLSVVLWSTSIAFSKSVMETFGNYKAMFLVYSFGGSVMAIMLILLFRKGYFTMLKSLSYKYYLTTGIFLLMNNLCLYLAIGLTANQNELYIVTIINYLWPIFIYGIKIPMFKLKVNAYLFSISILISVTGVVLSFLNTYTFIEIAGVFRNMNQNAIAYTLAFLTAVSWGMYSNLIRKHQTKDDIAAIPIIFILSGLVFLCILLVKGQLSFNEFNLTKINFTLVYTILFPTSIAYLCWYFAMKKGNKNLVTSASFLIPLLSILVINLKYSGSISLVILFAAFCLISGAFLSYYTVSSVEKGKESFGGNQSTTNIVND